MTALSDVDCTVLDLAGSGLSGAALAGAIKDAHLGEIEYYRRLRRLLGTRSALAAYPVLVNRLRRIGERR